MVPSIPPGNPSARDGAFGWSTETEGKTIRVGGLFDELETRGRIRIRNRIKKILRADDVFELQGSKVEPWR